MLQQIARQRKISLSILFARWGVALAAVLGSLYLASRPCVIGKCKLLQTAAELYQQAAQMTQTADSLTELAIAQKRLAVAKNLLQSIPGWSTRYPEAQQLLQKSITLNQVITACQQAAIATPTSQNPPHSGQEWQKVQARWQEAIALLKAVPSNSRVYPLAQQKLPRYQANLYSVNQQLNLEQQATQKLTQAKTTAQIAAKRQNGAQSLQDWQQVESTWRTTINILAAVPQNSTASKEAKKLLTTYRSQLTAVRDRTDQEQISATAYNQGVDRANLAKIYEQQHQFTQAVNSWNQALNSLQQVPIGTFYYRQAQPLITSYSSALKQAQDQLQVANILQQARTDLERTCTGDIRVCNYSLNNQVMTVQLTSDYERVVERSLIIAQLKSGSPTYTGIVIHYQTLRQALEAISDNADIPLQVYDASGTQIHNYKPGK